MTTPATTLNSTASAGIWQQPWRRLRKNRMAIAGLFVGAFMAIAGLTAPWTSAYLLHFSPEEQHTSFAFSAPGSADVSFDFIDYDGDNAAFATVDLDEKGIIACTLVRPPGVENRASAQALVARALRDPAFAWPQATQIELGPLVQAWAGSYRCPEIDALRQAERFYAFLPDKFDRQTGTAPLGPLQLAGHGQPDGLVSRAEFPNHASDLDDETLGKLTQRLGLLGPAAFARLDSDGDGMVNRAEITANTRWSRLSSTDLLQRFDANRDLIISKAEFPGLPVLHPFVLGTDQKGRDLAVRLLYGARISLAIGLLATLVSLIIGLSYGAIAGYIGKGVDSLMMRIVDVLYGLPFMFIVILLLVIVGRSTLNLFVALGAVSWLSMARIVRGQVISLREREFVQAAQAIGLPQWRILIKHILPNILGPVIVYATLSIPAVISEEAFLSFLGLGVQPPAASWGTLIAEGARLMRDQPWLIVFPSAALALTLLALNFVGDGLRDALDPRASR